MNIFTVEIAGKAICAFNETTRAEAVDFIGSEAFKADLLSLKSDEGNLWDGQEKFLLRTATTAERAAWETSRQNSDAENDEPWLVFLVPVKDLTD
jgi:hypothetical protein